MLIYATERELTINKSTNIISDLFLITMSSEIHTVVLIVQLLQNVNYKNYKNIKYHNTVTGQYLLRQ